MFKIFFNYVKLTALVVKNNLLTEMEYRFSFFSKAIGMMLNDVGLILVWVIFFNHFKSLNGWQLSDTIMLFGISMVNLAIVQLIAGGTEELTRTINRGELDYYMTLPKSILWQATTSKLMVSAIGDIAFGIFIFLFFGHPNLERILVFSLVALISAGIIYNFLVCIQSIGFFVGNFEEGADRFFHAMLGLTLYPENSFYGLLKTLTFTILPAFFVVWLPLSLVKEFQWYLLGGLILFWLGTLFLAIWTFNRGLKRYESGNLINLKM